MAVWNEITPGYDQEDQTANFGTRILAESDGSIIFEACTRALIKAGGQVKENPRVIAKSYQFGGVCIAVEKSLTVFKDERCSDVQFNIVFDANIDCCLVSEDGSCLLVGLQGGVIHCIHILTAFQIFSRCLPENNLDDIRIVELCCQDMKNDSFNVIIISQQGQIFRIPQVNFKSLSDTMMSTDRNAAEETIKAVSETFCVEIVSQGQGKSTSSAALVTYGSTQGLACTRMDGISIMPDIEKPKSISRNSNTVLCNARKMEVLENENIFMVLNDSSELLLVCPYTLIILKVWKDVPVLDFTLIPQTDKTSPQVLMLTQPDDNQQTWLQLAYLPLFEIKFRVKVSSVSHVATLSSDQLEFLYVEGVGLAPVETLHVKTLMETQPEYRFERILRRRKFEEAQELARTYNLDIELVFKAQAKQYVEDLDPWCSHNKNTSTSFIHLLNILDRIHDIQFICSVCTNAIMCDLSYVRRLLAYAGKRLSESNSENLKALNCEVGRLDFRLSTFEIINEQGYFEDWLKFCRVDFFSECLRRLEQGEIRQASLIWTRHWCELKQCLTHENSLKLLYVKTSAAPSASELFPWLRHFIPSVLSVLPELLENILGWAVRMTRNMEQNEALWPDLGLLFAENLMNLIKVESACDIRLSFFQQYAAQNSTLKELVELIKTLKQLKELKEKFGIHVSLAIFMQEDKCKVVAALLNKIAVSNIPQFFAKFLHPFMENCGLDSDLVVSDYAKNVVSFSGSYLGYEKNAPWEPMIHSLIPCITKHQPRLECIVAALIAAPVPWSCTISDIANDGLKINHPLTTKIRDQQKLISVKIIFKKYGFERYASDKCDYNTCLLHICHIIKAGRPEMLADCLQLSASYEKLHVEAYTLCFQHLIEKKQDVEAFDMFDKLDPMLMTQCIRKLANKLSLTWKMWYYKDDYSDTLAGLSERLKKNASSPDDDFALDILLDLRNLTKLKKEFNFPLAMKEFSSVKEQLAVMKSCTKELLVTSKDNIQPSDAWHLASLLKLSSDEGVAEFVTQALQGSHLRLAVNMARSLEYPKQISALFDSKLLVLCTELLEASTSDAVQVVHNLAGAACSQCPASVVKWLMLFEWSGTVLPLVGSETEGNNVLETLPLNQEDLFLRCNLSPLYRDPAAGSKKTMALKFVANIYEEGCLPTTEDLLTVSHQLHKENYDLTGLKIIYLFASRDPTIDEAFLKSMWCKSVCILLQKVVSSRQLDEVLGLNLLLSFGFHHASSWLSDSAENYRRDLRRLESVATLALLFYNYHGLRTEASKYNELQHYCRWSKHLVKLGIPIQKLVNDSLPPLDLLQILMNVDEVELETLKQFCIDFNLDLQEHLIDYLQTIFLNWKPVIQVVVDAQKTSVIVKNNEEEVIKKCHTILKEIPTSCHGMVVSTLEKLWDLINYYHYEMYLALQEVLDYLAPKRNKRKDCKLLLLFLKTYCRICQPQQQEKETWLEAFSNLHALPELSKWRLPFHQFLAKDVWSVVKPEVDLNTYKEWLKVAAVVNVEKDVICCVAIRQTIDKDVVNSSSSNEWCLYAKDSLLLEKIAECVSKCANLESASAALYYVARHTPPGADQVKAIELCYHHARKWSKQAPSVPVDECLFKVYRKYVSLATIHVLHTFGLASPCYLTLVLQPHQLVSALYHHPSILTRAREATLNCPDINGAVDEIATIHQLNPSKLRVELLADCMKPNMSAAGSLDQSSNDVLITTEGELDDVNLIRACYIVKAAHSVSATMNYLQTLAFNEEGGTAGMQLQAMRCLCLVVSEETLQDLFRQTLENIRKDMQTLHHIVSLQSLGMSYSKDDFKSCNKLELIKLLWRLPSRDQCLLDLLVRLCLDFGLFESWIWDSILSQMTQYHMQNELERLLPKLAEHATILTTDGFLKAWHYLVTTPFYAGDKPLTKDQEKACLHSLVLLQACPILNHINVVALIDRCIQVDSRHLGATLLPYLHGDERERSRQKLLDNFDLVDIIKQLQKSDYEDLLTKSKAVQILNKAVCIRKE